VLLHLEILIAMVLLHHKEQLVGIFEQSFGLVHSLTALLPHKKGGDLFLLSQKTKENSRLVLPRKAWEKDA
jgi:hypothetical protein